VPLSGESPRSRYNRQMAIRKRKNILNPANAVRLVQVLVDEGRILAHDIARYLHIAELEDRLKALRSGGGSGPIPFRKSTGATTARKRAKKAVSAEVAATRKLQGQYIANLRKFPKSARGKFQKIARTKSREEAIAAMKKALAT
jgi:hypothetical protein